MAATGRYVPPHLRNRPAGGSTPSSPAAGDMPPPGPPRAQGGAGTPPSRSNWSSSNNSTSSNGTGERWSRGGGVGGGRSGPSLYVFGDSFAGPFKLLDGDSARVKSFKGASAKGLNNPRSLKQLSKELLPLLNSALAPPPYAFMPPSGRHAVLLFGNVDLQINYLWQLQHKPIVDATWDESKPFTKASAAKDDGVQFLSTENEGSGPALGPDRFVNKVAEAYTAWLEREVIKGPIGRRAAEVAAQASGVAPGTRKLAPTKLLIAGALPPLVEDDILYRIPLKYVERMEGDALAAMQQLRGGAGGVGGGAASRTPWSRPGGGGGLSDLEERMAKTSISTPPPQPSASDDPPKISVEELLKYDPPLCTKPVRIAMTRRYNKLMSDFCAKYPDVLEFVDIADAMLAADAAERKKTGVAPPSLDDEVSRTTWACPVDPTNIHPLWEPTLPLWLEALKSLGLPTESFGLSVDAAETFKAYEEDKARRVEADKGYWESRDDTPKLKLRDE